MKLVFVFPGQGADAAGVAAAWYDASGAARRLLDLAAGAIGVPPSALFRSGGLGLQRTEALQPVLTAISLGVLAELAQRGVWPDVVVGHSLGEVAAVAAAGCLTPEAAVTVAALRGRVMAREAIRHPGGMLSLNVEDRGAAEAVVAIAKDHGLAALAAHNAPDQWVVAGEWSALRVIASRMNTTLVPVTGPWHTDAMGGGVAEYREALVAVVMAPVRVPLISSRSGTFVRRARDIPDLLARQLTCPVEWVSAMSTVAAAGITDAVVIGPGKALVTLVRRNLGPSVRVYATQACSDLEPIAEVLAR